MGEGAGGADEGPMWQEARPPRRLSEHWGSEHQPPSAPQCPTLPVFPAMVPCCSYLCNGVVSFLFRSFCGWRRNSKILKAGSVTRDVSLSGIPIPVWQGLQWVGSIPQRSLVAAPPKRARA